MVAEGKLRALEHDGFWLNRPTDEFGHLAPLAAGESHMKKTCAESRLARGRCSTDAFAIPGLIPIRSRSDSVPQRFRNSVMSGQAAEETREFPYAIALPLAGRGRIAEQSG